MTFCPLKDVCRLCGNKAKLLIGVFDPAGEALFLERKIRMCLPITVSTEDNMPKQVCNPCLQKLETSYELYLTCNSAQTTIKRLLQLQDLGNSSSTPKTCFINQCEREIEKNRRNEDTKNAGFFGAQATPSPPGKFFPNRTCIIESGPFCNRVPMSNGFSMSTSVVKVPLTPTQPVQQNAIMSNGTVPLNDFSAIGQIRTAEQYPMLSMQLQSVGQIKHVRQPVGLRVCRPVGQIKPMQQGPQMGHVFGASGILPSVDPGPDEPIDSKKNLLLNVQADKITVSAPVMKPTAVMHTSTPSVAPIVSHAPVSIATRTCRAKTASLKGIRRASSSAKVLKSTKTVESDSNIAKSSKTNNMVNHTNNNVQNGVSMTITEPDVTTHIAQQPDDCSAEAATAVAAILKDNDDHFDPLADDSSDCIEDITEIVVEKRPRLKNSDAQVACKYCCKMFSEDVIMLHQNLHLRVKFFSCMDCDKNFTTELGLNKHKCESRQNS